MMAVTTAPNHRRNHEHLLLIYRCIFTFQAQDDSASSRRRRRKRQNGTRTKTTTPSGHDDDDRPRRGVEDSDSPSSSSVSSEDDDDSSDDDEDDRNFDAMDANSLSYRDGASGGLLEARRSRRAQRRAERGSKEGGEKGGLLDGRGARRRGESSEESSSGEEGDGDDEEARRMSRRMADTYITESMSITPGSSVAVGSLMGRSLGHAMSSSFADDGLVWGAAGPGGGGGGVGTPDDAYFHEDVSPSVSPPAAASGISGGGRSRPLDVGGIRSKRALF